MSDFNSLENAFKKAGIRTEIKTERKRIVVKKKTETKTEPIELLIPRRHSNVTIENEYLPTERLALAKGFEEIADPKAYNCRYFIKNDKIWIHDIGALKQKLEVTSDDALRKRDYDVDTYYCLYQKSSIASNFTQSMYSPRSVTRGTYGDNMVYLSEGVYISESECWF